MAKGNSTETRTSVVNFVLNGQGAKTSLKEVGSAVNAVSKELRALKEADNPDQYRKLQAEKRALTQEYIRQKVAVGDLRSEWEKFWEQSKTVAMGVIGGNFVQSAVGFILDAIPKAMDKIMAKKDALTDIAKNANISFQEAEKVDAALGKIDTRTSRKDLRGMAAVAGQFNIATEEMADFVEGSNIVNVALGDQFDSAEDTVTALAKLDNILKDLGTDDKSERILRIGNAMNVLEADGVATGKGMADMGSRIGRALVPLQVGTAQVFGMSAALEELNVSSELGSTAVIEGFQRMLTHTETFAKVAGIPLKEYRDLIQKDIYGAFMAYLKGLEKVAPNQQAFAQTLEASKLAGSGAIQTFSALVSNLDLLEAKVKLAGQAISNTDSVTDEYDKKNYSLAVNLKKLGEIWDRMLTSDTVNVLAEGLVNLLAKTIGLTNRADELNKKYESQKRVVQGLNKDIVPLLDRQEQLLHMAQRLGGTTKLTADMQLELKDNIQKIAQAVPEAVSEMDKYGRVLDVNTGKARIAVQAQKELMKYLNKAAISESESELEQAKKQRAYLLKQRRTGEVTEFNGGTGGGAVSTRTLSAAELRKIDDEIAMVNEEEQKLRQRLYGLSEDTRYLSTADRRTLRYGDQKPTDAPAPTKQPTGSIIAPVGDDDKKEAKKKKPPVDLSLSFETYQEAVDAELKAYADLEKQLDEERKENLKNTLEGIEEIYTEHYVALGKQRTDNQITQEEYERSLEDLELTRLNSQIGATQYFGEQTLDLERQLSDALVQQTTDRLTRQEDLEEKARERQIEGIKRLKDAQFELEMAKSEAFQAGFATMRRFVDESSALYKFLFLAEKLFVIGDIVMKTQREIAGYYAANSWLGAPGVAVASALSIAAKTRMGISIATVAAQSLGEIGFREQGGFMGESIDTAGGMIDRPTLLQYGSRRFAVAEKVPEFVVSGEALKYRAVANFVGMLDGIQKTKNYAALSSLDRTTGTGSGIASGGSGGAMAADLTPLRQDIASLKAAILEQGSRPVVFNYNPFREFEDFILKIENETKA